MPSLFIPGEPIAQGRGRAVAFRRSDGSMGARVHDPERSRSWKGAAREAMRGREIIAFGPVSVEIRAYHSCPISEHRKRSPRPVRWRAKRPDAENVAKAALDAATGVLWADDAQVARLLVEQYTAAQGDAPGIALRWDRLPESPELELQREVPIWR